MSEQVLCVADVPFALIQAVFAPYGLRIVLLADAASIPGSFWGAPEAGLVASEVFVRPDTPLHSVFHEACHAICMGPERRESLHTNAGGNAAEECAVCYLQICLADHLPGFGQQRALADMDAWGYSFRLGSAAAWYQSDAEDARQWLIERHLLPCV